MRYEINKERIWVFAPVAAISTVIDVEGEITQEEIEAAIQKAVNQNEILKTRVVLEGEKAYLEDQPKASYRVVITTENTNTLIAQQEKLPFDLSTGEYLRFFLIVKDKTEIVHKEWKLLMMSHHLAGDGMSCAYLIQDIMKALNKETVEKKPVKLWHMEDLPPKSRLNLMMRLLMISMNQNWKKSERRFSFDEGQQMSGHYWKNQQNYIVTERMDGTAYQDLIQYSKGSHLTVNTLITTALCKAASDCGEMGEQDIGHAVSIRKNGYEGMGNFATGVSIQYGYDQNLSFEENAKKIQLSMDQKLKDDKKKYFLLRFMGAITGSLVDAIYFSAVEGYENKTAKTFAKMFGYDGNPKGISVTNLTRLPIADTYGRIHLNDYVFIPPLVLNAKRIFGIATLKDQMEISYVVKADENLEEKKQYFERVLKILKQIPIQ